MTIRVSVTGIDSSLLELDSEIKKEVAAELRERVFRSFTRVVAATPIDTGLARASWSKRKRGDKFVIKNDTSYIERLNYGTARRSGNRFIENAFAPDFDSVGVDIIPGGKDIR